MSAWMKWGRAVVHVHDLHNVMTALANRPEEDVLACAVEYEAKRHCLILRVVHVPELPREIGPILGDVISNLRASLDHLAWALVSRGKRPPDTLEEHERKGIYFPIWDDRKRFNGSLTRSMPGVGRANIAVVRRYQPYQAGKRKARYTTLAILRELSTGDKHREIVGLRGIPESGHVFESEPVDCTITRRVQARALALEVGAEVHRVYVRRTGPHPHMEMQPHLTVQVTVDPRVPVIDWSANGTRLVRQILKHFAPPPVEALKSIGVPGL